VTLDKIGINSSEDAIMPELPEVETVRTTLLPLLKNEIIESVLLKYKKLIRTDLVSFEQEIKNQKLLDIKRMGKNLIFMFDKHVMIVHLRMEGKFYLDANLDSKHAHAIFSFKSGKKLIYHDVRKFGTIDWYPKDDYQKVKPLIDLGPEPKDLSPEELFSKIKTKKTEIKALLLDQRIMSGLGNIYVDETLFKSHIHPTRPGLSLTLNEVKDIIAQAKNVLDHATKLGGSTIRSYQSIQGIHGKFQNELLVHLKKDQPCPVCHQPIIKIKVKGRGTYVCETCQR